MITIKVEHEPPRRSVIRIVSEDRRDIPEALTDRLVALIRGENPRAEFYAMGSEIVVFMEARRAERLARALREALKDQQEAT